MRYTYLNFENTPCLTVLYLQHVSAYCATEHGDEPVGEVRMGFCGYIKETRQTSAALKVKGENLAHSKYLADELYVVEISKAPRITGCDQGKKNL